MQRKVAVCINCQEGREIAAHGLCFKCYRAEERAEENPYAAADRHNRAQLKQLKKLRKCSNAILNALDDGIDVFNPEDVDAVRSILKPYFVSLAAGLAPVRENAVNSEQNVKNDVHSSQSQVVVENNVSDVNSEQVNAVHSSQPQVLSISPVPLPQPFEAIDTSSIPEGDVQNEAHYNAPVMSRESGSAVKAAVQLVEHGTPRPPANFVSRPLEPGKEYEVRPAPRGGFGIYEEGSIVLVQWHAEEDNALYEVAEAFTPCAESLKYTQEVCDDSSR